MKYSRYGITLTLLTEQDLELVRNWRNSPQVVRNYEYREYITTEMQSEWYKSIQNDGNIYLVVGYRMKKIGVINAKNIDWEKREFESGIFIPDPTYMNSYIPAILSVMMTDLFFKIFEWERIYAHILKTNPQAIQFNKSLGYELADNQQDVENQLYYLTRESFERKSARLKESIAVISDEEATNAILVEPSDVNSLVVKKIESFGKCSKHLLRTEITPEGVIYFF